MTVLFILETAFHRRYQGIIIFKLTFTVPKRIGIKTKKKTCFGRRMGFWTRKRGIRFCCDRLGFYAEILIIFGTVYCNRTRYDVSSLLINDHYCRQESLHKEEGVERSKCEFKEDTSIHPFFRSKNTDYKHSGYDRGHLAPAGNHRR